jgi:GNAT superfamily N-acetyltransferase
MCFTPRLRWPVDSHDRKGVHDMGNVKIRGWRRQDLGEVVELWFQLARHINPMDGFYQITPNARDKYRGYLDRLLEDRNYAVFVADGGGELIGFAMGRINRTPAVVLPETVGYIENIFIRDGKRGSGIGTALCERLLAWFRERQITHVELFYQMANSGAEAFWRRMGFTAWLAKAYRII